jgi:hypothetical protein
MSVSVRWEQCCASEGCQRPARHGLLCAACYITATPTRRAAALKAARMDPLEALWLLPAVEPARSDGWVAGAQSPLAGEHQMHVPRRPARATRRAGVLSARDAAWLWAASCLVVLCVLATVVPRQSGRAGTADPNRAARTG